MEQIQIFYGKPISLCGRWVLPFKEGNNVLFVVTRKRNNFTVGLRSGATTAEGSRTAIKTNPALADQVLTVYAPLPPEGSRGLLC